MNVLAKRSRAVALSNRQPILLLRPDMRVLRTIFGFGGSYRNETTASSTPTKVVQFPHPQGENWQLTDLVLLRQ